MNYEEMVLYLKSIITKNPVPLSERIKMNAKEKILFITGIVISLIGFMTSAGGIINIALKGFSGETVFIIGEVLVIIIMGIIPLLFGIVLSLKMKHKSMKRKSDERA